MVAARAVSGVFHNSRGEASPSLPPTTVGMHQKVTDWASDHGTKPAAKVHPQLAPGGAPAETRGTREDRRSREQAHTPVTRCAREPRYHRVTPQKSGSAKSRQLSAFPSGLPEAVGPSRVSRPCREDRRPRPPQVRLERIVATRRRQKDQHKRFLAALRDKRVREEVRCSEPRERRPPSRRHLPPSPVLAVGHVPILSPLLFVPPVGNGGLEGSYTGCEIVCPPPPPPTPYPTPTRRDIIPRGELPLDECCDARLRASRRRSGESRSARKRRSGATSGGGQSVDARPR